MRKYVLVSAIVGMVLTTPARAEEPVSGLPGRAAPSPTDVQLLDDVPNYAEILKHQWTEGVPADVTGAEESTTAYGRLLAGPQTLTSLPECIGLALANNTELQVQRFGPIAAGTQVRKARAIFDPAIFGTVSKDRLVSPATTFLTAGTGVSLYTQNFKADAGLRKTLLSGGQLSLLFSNTRYQANPSIANPLEPRYSTALGLSLNQPLLRNFGWRYSLLLVEVAQNTQQAAYHQYQAVVANIVAQVERAYWALVLAQQNVKVQEHGLALANEFLRQNEGKFAVGALAQTAVLEAKVNVAEREALLIQARNGVDVARDNLRALINAPGPNEPALLMIEPQDNPVVEPYAIDLERSLGAALTERPELQAARLDVHGKGLQRKVAENQLLPKLDFVGAVGVNGLSGHESNVTFDGNPVPVNNTVKGGYGTALDLLPDGRFYNYAAGATVEIPLGNASAKADYAAANIGLSQSRLNLQKLQEQVTLEIKNAVSNLQSDLKSIEATRIARQLAEENLRNQKARYDVGLATTKDLLDYGNRLTLTQFAEVQALTRYNTDLAEMRRADGTLLNARSVYVERVSPEAAPWWARF